MASLLQALDRYPLGCTEQIVSRALPLLYVNELSVNLHLAVDTGLDQRIARRDRDRACPPGLRRRLRALVGRAARTSWLDAYVTDFLTRARERGFSVPDEAFKLALDRLRNYVSTAPEPATDGGLALAYALYVLARNGVAPVGDVRYLADAKIDDLKTAIGEGRRSAPRSPCSATAPRREGVRHRAQRRSRKEPKIEIGRTDYGSPLRDAAVLVTLAAEGDAAKPILVNATERVDAAAQSRALHLHAGGCLARARRACARQAASTASMSTGEAGAGRLTPAYEQATSRRAPSRITNTGDPPVDTVVTVSGAPTTPEPAAEHGFKIERSYYTLDGEPMPTSRMAKQNERFVVVLKITEPQPQFGRVIARPTICRQASRSTIRGWFLRRHRHARLDRERRRRRRTAEFRDDRFAAAFDRNERRSGGVHRGLRGAGGVARQTMCSRRLVEDMYRPDRFGRTGTGKVEVQAAK